MTCGKVLKSTAALAKELRAKVMLLEAGRDELDLQAGRVSYAALVRAS